jgi:hypothetical protein
MRKPVQSSNAGNLEEGADWGGVSWVTFFGRTKKVTGCGAAPAKLIFKLLWQKKVTDGHDNYATQK